MISKHDVLVLDIDGTTVTSKKRIDAATQKALIELQERGITVVLASGRPPEGIYPLAEALGFSHFDGSVVAYNGAKVIHYKTKQCIYEQCLDADVISDFYYEAQQYGLGIMTYDDGQIITGTEPDAFMEAESSWSGLPIVWQKDFLQHVPSRAHQCIVTGEPKWLEKLAPVLLEDYAGRAEVFHSDLHCIEVTPCGMDKSVGLRVLFDSLKINPERVVCCGDSFNDIGMLQYAHIGVAMKNAPQQVRRIADYVTKRTNDEQGLLDVLARYFS